MRKQLALAAVSVLLSSSPAFSGQVPHWDYLDGDEGPVNWGGLDSKNASCSQGKVQSPVNLTNAVHAHLGPIIFKYTNNSGKIFNNGHTVQVDVAAGSSVSVDGIDFQLKQFHFHTPSEHMVNDKPFPMEMHLVHADKDGNLAVIGVMFQVGKENPALAKLWQQMPTKVDADNRVSLTEKVDMADLLPSSRHYYKLDGSLTTPPCTEGVRWMVLRDPVTASQAQIDKFTQLMKGHNARPVQPLGARTVLSDD